MKKLLLLLCVLCVALLAAQAVPAATIIVLNETEPSVVSVEAMTLSGDLEKNLLSVYGSGEVLSGESAKVYLFGPSDDIVIRNLRVNNLATTVSFDEKGYFFLAEKGEFSFIGDMEVRTIGQLALYVPGPVNELTFDLEHGYAIEGDRYGLFEDTVVIQRSEDVAMLVDGSFRYTYALRDTFDYLVSFKAFGSTLGSYTLNLPNGETVSSVTGALKWEQAGNALILDLGGSQASVRVTGFFDATALRIPLREDTHNVLIESDPEKKLAISTGAKEIDLSESSMSPQYPNGRAFLASAADTFSVSVKKLDLLPSLAASVRSASNTVAITQEGSVIGELNYDYANTGVDYIAVDAPGDPLYASTGYEAVKLTKDEKLLLSFPKTEYGQMDVVYFTTRHTMWPVDVISVPLASTELPITAMTSEIHIPGNYFVVDTFGAKGGSDVPSLKGMLLFLLIVGFVGSLLVRERRFVAMYVVFALGLLLFDSAFFLLLIAATLFVKVRQYIQRNTLKWILAGAGLLVALVLFGSIAYFGVFSPSRFMPEAADVSYSADYMEAPPEMAPAPVMKGLMELGEDEGGAITVPTRTGVLPVRLEIPALGKRITVTNELVTLEHPVALTVLVIATWLKWLFIIPSLLAGLSAYRLYRAAAPRPASAPAVPFPPKKRI